MGRLGEMVVRFGKVLGSAVLGEGSVTLNIAGIAGLDGDGDDQGEGNDQADLFGPLGEIGRPKPPSTDGSHAEKVSVKLHNDDDDTVFGFRDLRLNKLFPNPKEASIGRVHYGGGFWVFEESSANSGDQKASVFTLYIPYQFSGGTPAKAHAFVFDPVQGTVALVQGDGVALTLGPTGAVLKNKAGDAYLELNDNGVVLNGNVKVNGAVSLGDVTANFPLAKSAELITWAGLVNAALNGLGAPVAPLSASVATLLTKGS